jgi:hypothetical protein
MLAEARGYRLSIVAAHQHLGQLPRELREALSANARNKVFFNCSPEDAHVLERHVAPELSEHDLSHLGAHQAAVRLVVDWEETPAFTLRTEAAPEPEGGGEAVRAVARERFGRSRAERHEEALRRQLSGRRGTNRQHNDGSSSSGRSDGRPAGRSSGSPDLPGSPWANRQRDRTPTPATGEPDSWSDL